MPEPAAIRLAVVDDSAFVRKAIARIMAGEPDIAVVGAAARGEELIERLDQWSPTAVTLDLSMPGMGGLETLDRILAWRRIPVIILSGHSTREAPLAVEALHRGAADFVDKQEFSLVDFGGLRMALLERLRTLAGVPVAVAEEPAPAPPAVAAAAVRPVALDAIAIGASTGGPPAVERLLEALAAPPAVPLLIVQHMPRGFTAAFAERLNARLPFPVVEVTRNGVLHPGTAYIAPAGQHLRVARAGDVLKASLARYPETQHRPSVDVLFRSLLPLAPRVAAILLTGMGDDGAQGMLELAKREALTIAQDEASCIVYGMPRAAADLGAVGEQLPLSGIALRLRQLAERR